MFKASQRAKQNWTSVVFIGFACLFQSTASAKICHISVSKTFYETEYSREPIEKWLYNSPDFEVGQNPVTIEVSPTVEATISILDESVSFEIVHNQISGTRSCGDLLLGQNSDYKRIVQLNEKGQSSIMTNSFIHTVYSYKLVCP
jgi:hypothetical protein